MTADQAAALTGAAATLIGTLVWPALILFVVLRFTPQLRDVLKALRKLSFRGFGVEFSAERLAATEALASAELLRQGTPGVARPRAARALSVAAVIGAIPDAALRRLAGASVLWVDDTPDGRAFERVALEALGAGVTVTRLATAAAAVSAGAFDAIVLCPSGATPDIVLQDSLRAAGGGAPVLLYRNENHQDAQALPVGVVGSTDRPVRLVEWVVRALDRA